PLIYCLQSTDLPKNIGLQSVALPRDLELTPRFDRKLLAGVTVLEGKVEAAAERPWGDDLYQEFKPSTPRSVDIELIPYFSLANRGKSEITMRGCPWDGE